MSSSESEDDVVNRIRRGRDKEKVQRDSSSDARRDIDRRKRSNRTRRAHRQRAAESSSDSESGGGDSSASSSAADSDSDASGNKRILKKRQPAAREAERRSKTEAEKRKEKLRKLREQREAQKRNSNSGRGGGALDNNQSVGDALALDIDEEDLVKGEVLALSQRADFFKMQGPVGGVDDTVPLLSVGDFGLSVESLVQDAGGGQKGNDGLSKKGGRNKSRKKKSKAWVYVENMANGKFKRVPMSRLGYARLTDVEEDMEARRLGASRRDGPDLMTHRAHDITAFVSGVFQFAQGLLAGLSLLHLFLVQSITSYGTFQSVYQPLANESRRLYFVLASLGFASSIETYLRESENKELWSTLSLLQKVRIFVLGVLYVTTLGLSLAMMPTDTMIAISPADVSPESLSVWGVFEYIRSISSIIGWILVCIAVHEENQNGRLLLLHCSNLTREMDKQKLRLQNVSGKHLDSASPEELEELVAIQKAAVKSTERAIEFYRRRMENRVLTAGSP